MSIFINVIFMYTCIIYCRLGKPGVELTGLHDDINRVVQILPFASEVGYVYTHSLTQTHTHTHITD